VYIIKLLTYSFLVGLRTDRPLRVCAVLFSRTGPATDTFVFGSSVTCRALYSVRVFFTTLFSTLLLQLVLLQIVVNHKGEKHSGSKLALIVHSSPFPPFLSEIAFFDQVTCFLLQVF
jgi:hypothetical protein